MPVAKIRMYVAHGLLNNVAALGFEKTQGVKFPLALNNSWSDFDVCFKDDLVSVSLATKSASEDTCTHGKAAGASCHGGHGSERAHREQAVSEL